MTQTLENPVVPVTGPPYSRLLRVSAGVSLAVAGLTNGLTQYLGELASGGLDFGDQIAWGEDHPVLHQTEQGLMVLSALFLPLGLLGVAHVTRWTSRRLTLVAVPLMLWGMWGFHNVLAMGYVAGTVAPDIVGVATAQQLEEGLVGDRGVVLLALVPHLAGSFFGVLLLTVAAWRSGRFPRVACALVIVFLVWDFTLPTAGVLEPHALLAVAWVWMGVSLVRMPQAVWTGTDR